MRVVLQGRKEEGTCVCVRACVGFIGTKTFLSHTSVHPLLNSRASLNHPEEESSRDSCFYEEKGSSEGARTASAILFPCHVRLLRIFGRYSRRHFFVAVFFGMKE